MVKGFRFQLAVPGAFVLQCLSGSNKAARGPCRSKHPAGVGETGQDTLWYSEHLLSRPWNICLKVFHAVNRTRLELLLNGFELGKRNRRPWCGSPACQWLVPPSISLCNTCEGQVAGRWSDDGGRKHGMLVWESMVAPESLKQQLVTWRA